MKNEGEREGMNKGENKRGNTACYIGFCLLEIQKRMKRPNVLVLAVKQNNRKGNR